MPFVEDGRIKASVHIGDTSKKIYSGSNINDNLWHTLKFQRRGKTVELSLDEKRPIIGKYKI